jgi:hypothetical protein
MNKQKTLIFSLSTILFLALSFIVYSWTEPVANMPSEYTAPFNTSSTAQTKTGEIGASMFRDADNSNYYINPSGNSVVSGTITSANPTANGHLTTKTYVDDLFGNVEQEVSLSNVIYVSGINPPCPDGTIMIMRSWAPRTCVDSAYPSCGPCTTSDQWIKPNSPKPTCSYSGGYYYGQCGYSYTCATDTYEEALCAKITGEQLYQSKHTADQCELWNG